MIIKMENNSENQMKIESTEYQSLWDTGKALILAILEVELRASCFVGGYSIT
jgi:hypothetical protein